MNLGVNSIFSYYLLVFFLCLFCEKSSALVLKKELLTDKENVFFKDIVLLGYDDSLCKFVDCDRSLISLAHLNAGESVVLNLDHYSVFNNLFSIKNGSSVVVTKGMRYRKNYSLMRKLESRLDKYANFCDYSNVSIDYSLRNLIVKGYDREELFFNNRSFKAGIKIYQGDEKIMVIPVDIHFECHVEVLKLVRDKEFSDALFIEDVVPFVYKTDSHFDIENNQYLKVDDITRKSNIYSAKDMKKDEILTRDNTFAFSGKNNSAIDTVIIHGDGVSIEAKARTVGLKNRNQVQLLVEEFNSIVEIMID